jgi:RNA 2',3'-cyclic 3'-phosphodiesterase
VRLFLAVSPDAPARLRIDALRADVERAAGDAAPALRWVEAAVAHLTVHFLGEVDSGRLPVLVTSLESAVPGPAIDLTLGPPEVSPASGPPRVVWMPVTTGAERLAEVHRTLGERLAREGIAIERRPFRPHLTIARVRDREQRRARALGGRLRDLRLASIGWRVDHVTLFQSDLSGPTPRYEALHTVTLA